MTAGFIGIRDVEGSGLKSLGLRIEVQSSHSQVR